VTKGKIALDARRLGARTLGGIGHYVSELASRLPALAPEFEFLLLTDRTLTRVPDGCRQVVLGRAYPEGGAGVKLYSPLWMNLEVARFIRREGLSLFHGANYALPVSGDCRFVATVHDLAFIRVPKTFSLIHRTYLRSQVALSVRRADHIAVVSRAVRDDLIRLTGVDPRRVTVIHNGVDECYSVCNDQSYLAGVRSRLNLPERYLLYVGAIEAKKNIEALLMAGAPLVHEGLVDAIVLAGADGRRADDIRNLASELRLTGKAVFLGRVAQEAMPGLYGMARAFVFPSWFEGFGLPILESMACGTPVVASNSSSLPEVAGDAAILFPPAAPDVLGRELRRVLTDPSLRANLVDRGLARAAGFSWAASAARHLDLYRAVLGYSR
jgi:glycosyltransferase involved in cell wall biosynthesis